MLVGNGILEPGVGDNRNSTSDSTHQLARSRIFDGFENQYGHVLVCVVVVRPYSLGQYTLLLEVLLNKKKHEKHNNGM